MAYRLIHMPNTAIVDQLGVHLNNTFLLKQNKQDCLYQGEALNVPTVF